MGLGVHATVRREMKLELHHTININLCHLPDPHTLEAIEVLARAVAAQGDSFMTLSAAVMAKIAEIKAALGGIATQIQTGLTGIQGDIQALKDKIVAGGMSEAEILEALTDLSTSVATVGTAAQAVTDLDLANPSTSAPPVDPPVDPGPNA